MHVGFRKRESGVITIFVSLLLLILITVLITTAFSLSTTNLRAVGNIQARDEALAAAQDVIERVIQSEFYEDPAAAVETINVKVAAASLPGYDVNVLEPICKRATPVTIDSKSSVTLPGFTATAAWNTLWEVNVISTSAGSGASTTVTQGINVLMSTSDKNIYCPTA